MIVDSSVVLALLFGESRADEAASLLNENRDSLRQSSVNAAARTTGQPILTFDADFAGVDVEVVGL